MDVDLAQAFALDGRSAVVTGAASGIGRETAVVLARAGAGLALCDVDEGGLAETAAQVEAAGGTALARRVDVSDRAAIEALASAALERWDRLDVWVNVAGVLVSKPLLEAQEDDVDRLIGINLKGTYWGCAAAGRAMAPRGGGSIVNISSIDGLVGVEGLSTYVGSKFAVTGMTRSLALELGARGIRVNSIHPGIVETPMVAKNAGRAMARLRKAVARQPIARMGRPQEIAHAALFFASDESSYCTGASLVVDGGHIAGPYRDPM